MLFPSRMTSIRFSRIYSWNCKNGLTESGQGPSQSRSLFDHTRYMLCPKFLTALTCWNDVFIELFNLISNCLGLLWTFKPHQCTCEVKLCTLSVHLRLNWTNLVFLLSIYTDDCVDPPGVFSHYRGLLLHLIQFGINCKFGQLIVYFESL